MTDKQHPDNVVSMFGGPIPSNVQQADNFIMVTQLPSGDFQFITGTKTTIKDAVFMAELFKDTMFRYLGMAQQPGGKS